MPALARDETLARVQREGILRVGLDPSYPPFESLDPSGQVVGFDADLAAALAARLGAKAQFVAIHLDGLYDALAVGKCDGLISALPYDRTLTRDVLFSRPYFNAGLTLVVRAEHPVDSLTELAGQRVAVELGTEAHQTLRRLNRDEGLMVEILALRDQGEVLAAVRERRAAAAVLDRVAALAALRADSSVRQAGALLSDEAYVIAVRQDSPRLLAEINAALEEWEQEGRLGEMMNAWFAPHTD